MASAEIERSASVTRPYSMDGDWNDPRPRLSMAGDRIVPTDPAQGRVRVLDAAAPEVTNDVAVEGRPYDIAAVGSDGARLVDDGSDALDDP